MTPTMQRSGHDGFSPQEVADRLAVREIVDAYAFCADRRDVEGQMSLFTDVGTTVASSGSRPQRVSCHRA
jgi:hypothetical protein